MKNLRLRNGIFHGVTILFFVGALLFSVLKFSPVFSRVLAALKDLGLSMAYYGCFLVEQEHLITPTIGVMPADIETILPITIAQFKRLMEVYKKILLDTAYMERYVGLIGDALYTVSQTLLMLSLPMLGLVLVMILTYREVDNEHNKPTGFLRLWRAINRVTLRPIIFYVKKYLRWLLEPNVENKKKKHKWYKRGLIAIWFYNLSGVTIALELVAWYFYFSVSWDFTATLVFVAKVFADFTVPLFFIPFPLWLIISHKIFNKIRRKIALERIKAGIEKIKKFLKAHPGAKFVTGKQRSKKTSLLTQLKQVSECCILRPSAEEGCLTREKQFPYFPWATYNAFINRARARHRLYAWWGFHELFLFLRWAKATDKQHTEEQRKQIFRSLRRRWGYDFEDYCFGYDLRKGEIFDDGLALVHIYDALEAYGKLYMLYSQRSPLDVSNYPIRSDFLIDDVGNMPKFKAMLTDMDMKASMARSQYSHRIPWGAFRLGKQFGKNNPEYNSVEYGLRVVMESAKERKNQLTRRVAEKDEDYPTQDTDLVETEAKVHTHVATVDNVTYWEDLWDDQRANSLGADNTDLMTKIYIRKAHPVKFYFPMFALDEAVYLVISWLFDKVYKFIRHTKGSDTALIAFLWKVYLPVFRHYIRLYNQYSYYPLETKISDGEDNEVLSANEKLPLIALIAYKSRFRTDGLGEFYYAKLRGAALGLDGIKQYKKLSMTLPEMEEQESYMIKDFTRAFRGGRWKDPMKEWEKQKAKEKAA